MTRFTRASIVALLVLLAWAPARAETTLEYEGRLEAHGLPAQGNYDFSFRLFDERDPGSGEPISEEILLTGVPVTLGKFVAELAFEASASDAWLEVAVARSDGLGGFQVLEPRQRVTSESTASRAGLPAGIVTYFNLSSCPSGWSAYEPARGRTMVGLNPLGTLVGQVGTALGDLEERQHFHPYASPLATSVRGGHQHIWAKLASGWVWKSYSAAGSEFTVIDWGNGIGREGSGYYPLAATAAASFYTRSGGEHSHSVGSTATEDASIVPTLPYVQLLACLKD